MLLFFKHFSKIFCFEDKLILVIKEIFQSAFLNCFLELVSTLVNFSSFFMSMLMPFTKCFSKLTSTLAKFNSFSLSTLAPLTKGLFELPSMLAKLVQLSQACLTPSRKLVKCSEHTCEFNSFSPSMLMKNKTSVLRRGTSVKHFFIVVTYLFKTISL